MKVLEIKLETFEEIVSQTLIKHRLYNLTHDTAKDMIVNTVHDKTFEVEENTIGIQQSIHQVLGDIHLALKYVDGEGIQSGNILETLYEEFQPYVDNNPYL